MNAQERFPMFQGRKREIERLQPLLENCVAPLLDPGPVDWRAILECHYDPYVPFHGPVHLMYGLLWLVYINAPVDVMYAWLCHDADHTGIRSESPESMHADVAEAEFGHDLYREAILQTTFPYAEMQGSGPDEWVQKPAETILGAWLRRTDTLRGYTAGGNAFHVLLGSMNSSVVHLYESLGYGFELIAAGTFDTHEAWYRAQATFFPNQLYRGIHAGSFGPPKELESMSRAVSSMQGIWNYFTGVNYAGEQVRDPEFERLATLREYWLQDITLPEFAAFSSAQE
jgi:hypothetical protein